MISKFENPLTNALSQGISEQDILEAVKLSGYPLQTIITEKLKSFDLTEEWSFVDRDTKSMRNIDILAEKRLYSYEDFLDTRVRPYLSLLIECKQSSLPYVFFLTKHKPFLDNFPIYTGLFNNNHIQIKSNDTRDTWSLSINRLFGLVKHDFICNSPYNSKVFSKCVRKGREFELSGSDTYNSVVMPVIKAMSHYSQVCTPPKTAHYFSSYLTMGIAVIDGPMLGINVNEDGNNELVFTPWVRVLRHENDDELKWMYKGKHYVIDVIHKDFFSTYIEQHLMPFAESYASYALKHAKVLANGKGFIKGMGQDCTNNLEDRLK